MILEEAGVTDSLRGRNQTGGSWCNFEARCQGGKESKEKELHGFRLTRKVSLLICWQQLETSQEILFAHLVNVMLPPFFNPFSIWVSNPCDHSLLLYAKYIHWIRCMFLTLRFHSWSDRFALHAAWAASMKWSSWRISTYTSLLRVVLKSEFRMWQCGTAIRIQRVYWIPIEAASSRSIIYTPVYNMMWEGSTKRRHSNLVKLPARFNQNLD